MSACGPTSISDGFEAAQQLLRVPLIYVYSVPDVMKLAKALADGRRERREFDHVRAQSATIRAVTPGAALRMPFARARPTARADAHPRRHGPD